MQSAVHSNIALLTIATVTEVTISDSFYQGNTSFYVHYMVIQAQVVCELNFFLKGEHTTCTYLNIGKQPCLRCLVTLDDLERSCSLRAPFPERTLQSRFDDY